MKINGIGELGLVKSGSPKWQYSSYVYPSNQIFILAVFAGNSMFHKGHMTAVFGEVLAKNVEAW